MDVCVGTPQGVDLITASDAGHLRVMEGEAYHDQCAFSLSRIE
jgi:hypothetical protein